jgi:hypothetical protein
MSCLCKIAAHISCRRGQDIYNPQQLVATPSTSHGHIDMSSAAHDDEEGGHQGGNQGEDDDVDDVDYDELGMS